ncbi:MAG TPA: tetratricopeptide repeat protein [Gemmataceae bacterium]|nr:tetratricopeptide repeat protein [Gemmataceae bacterium]
MPSRKDLLICLALAAGTAGAFAPVLRCGFVNYDDPLYVTDNRPVQQGLSAANVAWAFRTTHATNWHPLTWLSLMLDRHLDAAGRHPLAAPAAALDRSLPPVLGNLLGPPGETAAQARCYHLTNLAFHTAAALLLFLALRRLTGAVWCSALVAPLFAVHPLRVESVAWVAERKDVLSAFFWMLTLWLYAGYAARPSWWRYLLVVLAFALGLLAKPMLVTLPCVLLLLDWWPLRRLQAPSPPTPRPQSGGEGSQPLPRSGGEGISRRAWAGVLLEKLPLFALAAASCVVTYYAQEKGGAVGTLERYSPGARVANAAVAYVGYVGKAVWPSSLAVFYPHRQALPPGWQWAGAGLVLAGVSALAVGQARRRPYLLVGWLWYLGTLVPVIGLVQVGEQAMADRYTYVPLVGLSVAAAWGLGDFLARRPQWRGIVLVGAAALLAACVALTWRQALTWRDSVTLWEQAVAATSNNCTAHYNLGCHYLSRGQLDEAAGEFERALAIRPRHAGARTNLGLVCQRRGQLDAAIAHYRRVLTDWPEYAMAHHNLGAAYEERGRLDEAAHHLAEAARLSDDPWGPRSSLGRVLLLRGQTAEAADHLRRAVALRPDYAPSRFYLAFTLYELGQADEAEAEYREAKRLQPDWPEAARRRAWRLATDPNAGAAHANRAVLLARAASWHGDPEPAELDVLAAAYAAAGRFDDARAAACRALRVASAAGDNHLARAIKERLHLYQSGRPYRQ